MRKPKTSPAPSLTTLQPNAAGADIGAREIYVAVPPDRSAPCVRCFGTFTDQLRALVAWLRECRVDTVAMEATSVYWIPLAEMLEEAGIAVCLVNPRHVKNVPGRKTDVQDCQWLQYLHSVGLLRAAFRAPAEVRPIRVLWRHRDALVRQSAWQVQHIHKAFDQMNARCITSSRTSPASPARPSSRRSSPASVIPRTSPRCGTSACGPTCSP
ncbi:MAG TPA: transposase [Lacunisphaera sp.]|nr:transposase [Lacunisphaera sp.]